MNDLKNKGLKQIWSKDYWLGQDQSAVNINRFWLYLGALGFALCLTCLLRAIESTGYR